MLDTIKILFRSRKFVAALAAIISSVVVALIPSLQNSQSMIIAAIVLVTSVFIGGVAYEDASSNANTAATRVDPDPNSLATELDELLRAALEQFSSNVKARLPSSTVTTTVVEEEKARVTKQFSKL